MNHIAYVGNLLRFAFAQNPLLHVSLVVSLVSVVVELAAMSVLFPLSALALGKPVDAGMSFAGGGWVIRMFDLLGIATSVRTVALVFFAIFLLRVLTLLAGQWLIFLLGKRLFAQLSSLAFENTIRSASIKSIDEKSVGYFITLAGDESFRASNLVIAISQFAGMVVLGVLYFASIAYYSPTAAVAVSLFLVLCFLALLGTFRESHRLGAVQVEESQLSHAIFLDALNGVRVVRAMTAESYVVERYRSVTFRYVLTLFRVDLLNVLAKLAPVALLLVFGIVLLWTWDEKGSGVDAAFVFVLLMFLMRFFPVVGQALRLFMQVLTDARAGRDVLAATAVPVGDEIPRTPLSGPVRSISVRNVEFGYSPDKPVLRGFSTEFVTGRSYAIVGPSGSGKSTLLDLILGFRDPDAGGIFVNGRDTREVELTSLRGRIVLLSQQATVFNDSVYNNVLFGADLGHEAVARACNAAHLEDMVAGLPEGYETKLAYQGSNLSGGQRQRIGLARALVRDPDVLILDESTNALDRETRIALVEGILREFASRIVIVITHDLEIAAMVNEVIDMEHHG